MLGWPRQLVGRLGDFAGASVRPGLKVTRTLADTVIRTDLTEAVEKRICRGRRADLRSQIAAGSAS